ncbi:hypothetical protein BS17DRAFT_773993 [Gyrodon lividus]|nr:hypothetical protein BS17DRAFT_773993 [Gyrodon lividus]
MTTPERTTGNESARYSWHCDLTEEHKLALVRYPGTGMHTLPIPSLREPFSRPTYRPFLVPTSGY